MEKNNFLQKSPTTDIDATGMHLSEIAGFLKAEPGGEEVVVNEEEQTEVVNQDEDKVNGLN